VRCSNAELKFGVKFSERRDERCLEEMERDHRVRDPEPAEERVVEQGAVEAQEVAAGKEEWAATAPEQDLRETACVLPAVPRSRIRRERPAIRSPVPNAEPR
jgi:hypothetical protein